MNSDSDTLAGGLPHSEIPGSTIARISPGLSQRATSFIASQCQGIHQMPLFRLIQEYRSGRHQAPKHPGQPSLTGASPSFRQGSPLPGFPRRRGVFHEDTSSGRPACELIPAPRRRPPRSHSQIRFTRSINNAPDTRSPAGTHPARLTRPRNKPASSPNVVIRDQGSEPAKRGPGRCRPDNWYG